MALVHPRTPEGRATAKQTSERHGGSASDSCHDTRRASPANPESKRTNTTKAGAGVEIDALDTFVGHILDADVSGHTPRQLLVDREVELHKAGVLPEIIGIIQRRAAARASTTLASVVG